MHIKKSYILGTVALLTFMAIWYYMNTITYKSDAAAHKVTVLILHSPTLNSDNTKTAEVVLKTVKPANKISGFDISFVSAADTDIIDVGSVRAVEQGVNFIQLMKGISPHRVRISYVIPQSARNLPSTITIPVYYKTTSAKNGSIEIDEKATQITGNIPGIIYALDIKRER